MQKIIKDTDCGTELLPPCWNEDPQLYSLRYALGNDVYILKCILIDNSTALFNLYNVAKGTVSNLSFELREVFSFCSDAPKKKLVELMPRVDVHIMRIREELVLPVAGCYNCSNDTMNKRPDPVPPQRPPVDFKCLPNLGCPWPPNTAFGFPNNHLLVPVENKNPCCLRQQLTNNSMNRNNCCLPPPQLNSPSSCLPPPAFPNCNQ